ncbi:MAG: hypothetical protein WDO18_05095 [Acidobacteriota bacterium]
MTGTIREVDNAHAERRIVNGLWIEDQMSDYMFMLESHLTGEQYRVVGQVKDAAQEAGLSLFLTGGAMRDIMGGFPVRGPRLYRRRQPPRNLSRRWPRSARPWSLKTIRSVPPN